MPRVIIFSAILIGIFCTPLCAFQKGSIEPISNLNKEVWEEGKSYSYTIKLKLNSTEVKFPVNMVGYVGIIEKNPSNDSEAKKTFLPTENIEVSPKIKLLGENVLAVKIKNVPIPDVYIGVIDFYFTDANRKQFKISTELKWNFRKPSSLSGPDKVYLSVTRNSQEELTLHGLEAYEFDSYKSAQLEFALADTARGNYISSEEWSPLNKGSVPDGLLFQLNNFQEKAGTYRGKAKVTHPDLEKPYEFAFTVKVRDSFVLAFVVIFIGLAVGRMIRLFAKNDAPIKFELLSWINELKAHQQATAEDVKELESIEIEVRLDRDLEMLEDLLSRIDFRLNQIERREELIAQIAAEENKQREQTEGDYLKPTDWENAEEWINHYGEIVEDRKLSNKDWFKKVRTEFKNGEPKGITQLKDVDEYCKSMDITLDKRVNERAAEPFKRTHQFRLKLNTLLGINLPRHSKYWGLRLATYVVVLLMFTYLIYQTKYVPEPTFGAGGFSDYYDLLAWAAGGNTVIKNIFAVS